MPIRDQNRTPLLFLMIWLSGCALYKPDSTLDAEILLPSQFGGEVTRTGPHLLDISTTSKELNRLVQLALKNNHSLLAAAKKLERTGYGARIARSDRLPELNYQARFSHTDSKNGAATKSWSLGLAGRYEIDLWGKFRSRHKAAVADMEATYWDWQAAQITIAYETALRWVDTVAARQELALVQAHKTTISETVQQLEQRRLQGRIPLTDVLGQQQLELQLASELPLLQLELETAIDQLGILVADPAMTDTAVTTVVLPPIPDLPAIGLPADVIANRPDVQVSWYQLLSSRWGYSSAQANRLPTLALSGSFEFMSATPSGLFESWISSFIAGISGPLFDFRGRKFAVKQARASAEENLEHLQQTLLIAYFDVETALSANRYLSKRGEALKQRARIVRQRADNIRLRYLQGNRDYLDIQAAKIDEISADRAIVNWWANMLRQRIQLLRAYGEPWPTQKAMQTSGTVNG